MIILNSQVSGRFKFEVTKKNGEKRVIADWFQNLITNSGLDLIGTISNYLSFCRVGTGSGIPENADAYLDNQIAYTSYTESTSHGTFGTSPRYVWYKITKRFAEGIATGNLSEVGMSNTDGQDSGDVLFSRALILDGEGDPTTITVLANETLDVTYEFRRYIPESDTTGTVELRGNNHNYTGRASLWTSWKYLFYGGGGISSIPGMDVYNGVISDIDGFPDGTGSSTTSKTIYNYSNGNYYRDWKFSLALDQGNLSGFISACRVDMIGSYYQFGFSPDIEKTSDDIMSLTFRASWSRRT